MARIDAARSGLAATPAAAPEATRVAPRMPAAVVRRPDSVRRLLDGSGWWRLTLGVDLVLLYVAGGASVLASGPIRTVAADRLLAAAFPPVVVVLLRLRRAPEQRINPSLIDASIHVVGVLSFAAIVTIAAGSMVGIPHPATFAMRLWLYSCIYLGVARLLLLSLRHQARRSRRLATPTLIVGAGTVGEHLLRRLTADPGYGLRPVGFLDSAPMNIATIGLRQAPGVPILGGTEDLGRAIELTGARHVILAFSGEPDHVLVEKVRQCQELGVEVSLVPRLFESINERTALDHVGGLPLLALRPVDPRGWQFAVKHSMDRVLAAAALLVLSPLMLVIAGLVRLSSPGPILYRQRRVGQDGRRFDLLKFRTMREDAEVVQRFDLPCGVAPGGVEGIDRRTLLGRVLRASSLDELPQFLNVLRGEMSLVGPRPERPEYVERFARDIERYEDRHRVKSGITGWAQVNGLRGQTSIADRVEWDNYYIRNWSLSLDVRILALTVAEVLRFRDRG
jgi:exopolysaccharide biosynthesis polyprenyl glycosylphosphotransferase